MATCSASELLADGACFTCLTKKQLQIVIAQLLCEISAGGGGGGGGEQVTSGNGAPSSTPTGSALYYDNLTGTLYQWNGSAWV